MSILDWGNLDSGQTWVYAPTFNGAAPTTGFDYWIGSYGWMSFVADASHTQWPAMQATLPLVAPDWWARMKLLISPANGPSLSTGSQSIGIGFHDSGSSAKVSVYFQPYSAGSELLMSITTSGGSTTTYTAAIGGLPGGISDSTLYWVWLKIEALATGARCKFWLDGASEPGSWTLDQSPTTGMTWTTFDCSAKTVNATVATQAGFSDLYGVGTTTVTTTPVPGQLYPLTQLGTGNGSNTTFTASTAYETGSLLAFVNGVQTDTTELDPSAGTFDLPFAPQGTTGGLPAEVVEAMWWVGI